MRKPSFWRKGYPIEKRVIGNDDAGELIFSRRIPTSRAGSMARGNLVKLIKVISLSALALGLGLPQQRRPASDNDWIGGKDRFSVSMLNALDEENHNNEKRLRPVGPINDDEVKRLKLMFLLMMSLGQYRSPGH